MKYNKLGNTDVKVSSICLGTMTYGQQNSEVEGHQQLDYAVDHDINFIDTAELYSIPPDAETYGSTETIIGSWIKKRGRRDEIVLASKIAGGGFDWVGHIREGKTRFSAYDIDEALNASLKRLQTDYIDLYQLHWPERNTNYFGKLNYQQEEERDLTPIEQTLRALQKHVQAGKIRYVGLSNETPWGIMQFLTLAKQYDLPVIASVQNPYSLLNRSYEIGCAEISHREKVGLLAYSPLGFGVLSGKYLNDNQPAGARMTIWPSYSRYTSPQAILATQAYVDLAKKYELNPAQMALAFVNSRPFLISNIIGATTMQQLEANIASIDIELSSELLSDIELIHQTYSNPAP